MTAEMESFFLIERVSEVSVNGSQNCSFYRRLVEMSVSNRHLRLYITLVLCVTPLNLVVNGLGLFLCVRERNSRNNSVRANAGQRVLLQLLIGLAITEILFNLNFLLQNTLYLMMIQESLHAYSLSGLKVLTVFYAMLSTLVCGFQMCRNWTVVMISLLRLIAVLRPFTTYAFFTQKLLTPLYATIITLCLSLGIPRTFENKYIVCEDSNRIMYSVDGFMRQDKMISIAYYGVTLFISQSGGPVILVALFSAGTMQALCNRAARRSQIVGRAAQSVTATATNAVSNGHANEQEHDGNSRSQRQTADRTVIILGTIFFFCELPIFFSKVFPLFGIKGLFDAFFLYAANFMTCLDSFLNFVVYMLANKRFQERLLAQLRRFGLCTPSTREDDATVAMVAPEIEHPPSKNVNTIDEKM